MIRTHEIDWSNPVVREHPLLRGCSLFAVPFPGRMVDLLGRYHGTYTSMVPGTTSGMKGAYGRPGGRASVRLDGTNDYVTFGSVMNTIGAASQSLTVALWFKAAAADITNYPQLIDKTASSNSRPFQLFFWVGYGGSNRIRFQQFNGSTNPTADTSSLYADDKWHHVVGVRDCQNSLMKIYIDGADSTAFSSNVGFTTNFSASSSIDLGNRRNGMATYYNGFQDEAMIWPARALTATQVRNLYQQSRMGHPEIIRRLSRTAYYLPSGTPATTILPFVNHYMLG